MKTFALAALILAIVHYSLHRHPFPRTGPQRTPEDAARWAAHYRTHHELLDGDGGGYPYHG